jgi:hypothetical protein
VNFVDNNQLFVLGYLMNPQHFVIRHLYSRSRQTSSGISASAAI